MKDSIKEEKKQNETHKKKEKTKSPKKKINNRLDNIKRNFLIEISS
jgi:hypothetical protein